MGIIGPFDEEYGLDWVAPLDQQLGQLQGVINKAVRETQWGGVVRVELGPARYARDGGLCSENYSSQCLIEGIRRCRNVGWRSVGVRSHNDICVLELQPPPERALKSDSKSDGS